MRVEWITDRLPDKPGWYLVTVRLKEENFNGQKYAIQHAYFGYDGEWQAFFRDCIVAWMNLPEPWVPDDESDNV